MLGRFLNQMEAAHHVGISARMLRFYLEWGSGPPRKRGRKRLYYDRIELEAWARIKRVGAFRDLSVSDAVLPAPAGLETTVQALSR